LMRWIHGLLICFWRSYLQLVLASQAHLHHGTQVSQKWHFSKLVLQKQALEFPVARDHLLNKDLVQQRTIGFATNAL
jgi:hypothetical protein